MPLPEVFTIVMDAIHVFREQELQKLTDFMQKEGFYD
jgi:hypothetical protein